MLEFAEWLQATPLSVAVQSIAWLIPTVQSIHILMVGIVFVSMLMIALRVMGVMRADEPFGDVLKRFAPWMWTGLAVMALTGVILVIGEPPREFSSLSFRIKMALLAVAVASAAAFRLSLGSAQLAGVANGEAPEEFSAATKSAAAATIALWLVIIFLGRAIAYDVEVWGALSPSAG